MVSRMSVLAVLISSPFWRSVLAEESSPAPAGGGPASEVCKKCEGLGKLDCPKCKGIKKTSETCSACKGVGTEDCPSAVCKEFRAKKKRYQCPSCPGTGIRKCTKCKGDKRFLVECKRCLVLNKPTGKIACPSCDGKGTIPIRVVLPPKLPQSKIDDLKSRLLESSRSISQSMDRFRSLKAESESLASLRPQIQAEVKKVEGSSEAASARLLEDTRKVLDRWSSQERAMEEAMNSFQNLVTTSADAESHLEKIGGLLPTIDQVKKEESAGAHEETGLHENYAREFEKQINLAVSQFASLKASLGRYKTDILEVERRWEEEANVRKVEERRQEEIRNAFSRFQKALLGLPSVGLFAKVESDLSAEAPQAPQDLCVSIKFVDEQAEDARQMLDVRLSEDCLKQIPEFIREVFDACEYVKTVSLSIWARHLGRTGLRNLQPVQKFTFLANDWKEFMTGEFKDDWRYLLSESKPKPIYPRASAGYSTTIAICVVIALCSVLSIGLLAVLRLFFKRP